MKLATLTIGTDYACHRRGYSRLFRAEFTGILGSAGKNRPAQAKVRYPGETWDTYLPAGMVVRTWEEELERRAIRNAKVKATDIANRADVPAPVLDRVASLDRFLNAEDLGQVEFKRASWGNGSLILSLTTDQILRLASLLP